MNNWKELEINFENKKKERLALKLEMKKKYRKI